MTQMACSLIMTPYCQIPKEQMAKAIEEVRKGEKIKKNILD